MAKLIAQASPMLSIDLSKSEQKEAIALVENNRRAIAKDNPKTLVTLQNGMEGDLSDESWTQQIATLKTILELDALEH